MITEISGIIDQEAFSKITRAYNELELSEPLIIYLNSQGGDPDIADAIVDVINSSDGPNPTILIAYGKIFSAAFDLFYKAQCTKRLLDGTIGMAHLSEIEMDSFIVTDTKDTISASTLRKWWAEDKKKRLSFYEKMGIEKKDLMKIKKGEDVYFQHERLLELLNGKPQ